MKRFADLLDTFVDLSLNTSVELGEQLRAAVDFFLRGGELRGECGLSANAMQLLPLRILTLRGALPETLNFAGMDTGNWGSVLSGMPMVTRPKARANAEDDYVFTVMAAMAPQFRVDFNGQMPVAHGVL